MEWEPVFVVEPNSFKILQAASVVTVSAARAFDKNCSRRHSIGEHARQILSGYVLGLLSYHLTGWHIQHVQ